MKIAKMVQNFSKKFFLQKKTQNKRFLARKAEERSSLPCARGGLFFPRLGAVVYSMRSTPYAFSFHHFVVPLPPQLRSNFREA